MTPLLRPRPARGSIAGALLTLSSLLGMQSVASAATQTSAQVEGPLRNQTFVPVADTAAEALTSGDLAWTEGRSTEAVDAWFEALIDTTPGQAVPLDLAAVEPRAFEGVEEAVLRRLQQDGAARAWSERFEALATETLGPPSGPAPLLARVERLFPSTAAAATAALVLGDRALERGDLDEAELLYRRAGRHLVLAGGDAAPLSSRLSNVSLLRVSLRGDVPTLDAGPLTAAPVPTTVIDLVDPRGPSPVAPTTATGAGLYTGGRFLGPSELVVQTATRVHLVDLDRGLVTAQFEPGAMVADALGEPDPPLGTRSAPAWELQPAVSGRTLLVVAGRASRRGERGNALVCIDLPRPPAGEFASGAPTPDPGASGFLTGATAAPSRRWARGADARVGTDGGVTAEDLTGGDAGEFQPGPVLAGGVAVAALRNGESELSSRLVGLDVTDGRLLWNVLTAVGAERNDGQVRLTVQSGSAGAASPLLAVGGSVFVGTQLGAGSLVDAVDGRLRWTVLNRRRASDQRGWSGRRAFATADRSAVVWAPADSDRLYWLPVGPLRPTEDGPFVAPPRPIDASRALIGIGSLGDRPAAVLTTDVGPRQGLALLDLTSGRLVEALHLFPGEGLREGAHVGPSAVLLSSDRAVYAFDPARELLLTHRTALPSIRAARSARWTRGGAVLRLGQRAVLVENERLTVLSLGADLSDEPR